MLADFGIARTMDDSAGLTATNSTIGTFAYAAPEQLMGLPIDGRADQYAWAATTYHLRPGRRYSRPPIPSSRSVTISMHRRPPTEQDPPRSGCLGSDPGHGPPRKIPPTATRGAPDFARALTAGDIPTHGQQATAAGPTMGSNPAATTTAAAASAGPASGGQAGTQSDGSPSPPSGGPWPRWRWSGPAPTINQLGAPTDGHHFRERANPVPAPSPSTQTVTKTVLLSFPALTYVETSTPVRSPVWWERSRERAMKVVVAGSGSAMHRA